MSAAFAEFGVVVAMLERRLGHKLEATIEQELIGLRKIFVSLKDGMSKREDWFDVNAAPITRPKFDGEGATSPDEKAEAAAGLAPSSPPPEQPRRGRPKKAAATEPPVQSPAPVVQPTAPAPTTTGTATPLPPAATVTADQTSAGQTSFAALASEPYNQLQQLMEHSQITEAELVLLCKRRGLMSEQQEELLQLVDAKLHDLVESWPSVAGQVRINRRAQAPHN
jgi:hypothetical protein